MNLQKNNEMNSKIGVVDYGMGNIMSVFNALKHLGYENIKLVDTAKTVDSSDVLILPGVGAFTDAMNNLKNRGMIEPLNQHVIEMKKPILGICLGMQLFLEYSYEGKGAKGLGWIKGEVLRFNLEKEFRVPHMGWDTILFDKKSEIFDGIDRDDNFYFVHSYFADCDEEDILASCEYGINFAAAIKKDNMIAFQFHPEKSYLNGLKLLDNSIKNLIGS